MNNALHLRRGSLRRGGFTLIEVAIALVIFVIGALAIIRIFPPALGAIQNSGDQLTAMNISRGTLAKLQRQGDYIPDTTYDAPAAMTNWQAGNTGSVMGSGRRNNSIPFQVVSNLEDEYNKSALGHFKSIAAEKHTISSSGYVLLQFPFSSYDVYLEDELTGITVDSDGTLQIANAIQSSTSTAYDPSTASIKDKTYVSYRWVENGKIWGATEELVNLKTVLPLKPKVAQAVRYGGAVSQIVPMEVTVRLRKWIDSAPLTAFGDQGAIQFPIAEAGKKYSFDYVVKDWRWMTQDGTPTLQPDSSDLSSPPATARVVTPPIRPLDKTQSPYVFTFLSAQNLAAPELKNSSSISGRLLNINPKTGRVMFSSDDLTAPQSRVVYRTLDNWAHQLSVAARSYNLVYDTASLEPWRDCALASPFDGYLYFPASEAGKTVSVSYSYLDTVPVTDVEKKIVNKILTIKSILIAKPSAVPAGLPSRVSRLELLDNEGALLTATTPLTSIESIEGASIQARTAWLNGDKYTQTSTIGFRGASN